MRYQDQKQIAVGDILRCNFDGFNTAIVLRVEDRGPDRFTGEPLLLVHMARAHMRVCSIMGYDMQPAVQIEQWSAYGDTVIKAYELCSSGNDTIDNRDSERARQRVADGLRTFETLADRS